MSFITDVLRNNPISVIWRMTMEDTTIEPSDEGNLAVVAGHNKVSAKEAAELIQVSRANEGRADEFSKQEEASIQLDSDDSGFDKEDHKSKVSKSEKATEFRASEAMKEITSGEIKDVPAGELENNPREAGGKSRGARGK